MLLPEELVFVDEQLEGREAAIEFVASAVERAGRATSAADLAAHMTAREQEMSTAMGFGIAIPHAKSAAVTEPALSVIRLAQPVDWSGEEVHTVFGIAVPAANEGNLHLKIIANLARKLVDEDWRRGLTDFDSAPELHRFVSAALDG